MSNQQLNGNVDAFRPKLSALLLMTGIFFLNFLSRVILGPMMPAIEKDLGLDHTMSGTLFLMISFGYFITLACSGLINSRISHRKTIVMSAWLAGLALLVLSQTRSAAGLRYSLIVLGLATGLYLPSAIPTITSLIHPRNWGKALAIHEMAPNISLLLAPVISEIFLLWFSWSRIGLVLGCLSLGAGLIFALFGKSGDFKGQPPRPDIIFSLVRRPSVWIMMILIGLGVGNSMGVYNMMPLFLVNEAGLDRTWANTLVSFSRIAGLFLAFAVGWATDRIGEKKALMAVLAASGLASLLLGLLQGRPLIAMVFIQAALTACFFPPGLAALAKIGSPDSQNMVVSCTIPVAFLIGGGLFPTALGYMGDHHSFAAGLVLTGGLVLGGCFLVPHLRFFQARGEPGQGV